MRTSEKLILGTVQFGMDYGIANSRGQVRGEEVPVILRDAWAAGIRVLDTAYQYGQSEQILGRSLPKSGADFKIITKMPDLLSAGQPSVENLVTESLNRLGQDRVYGYLVHKFQNFVDIPDLDLELARVKSKGWVEKIGVSLYKPDELMWLLDNKIDFDIVQIPYSILDQRFEPYLALLKDQNKEIHARSVFLQGLFFLEDDRLRKKFSSVYENIRELRQISDVAGIGLNTLCLGFAALNHRLDGVLIGIDSREQLRSNIDSIGKISQVTKLLPRLKQLASTDETVLLPYEWNR